MRTSVYECEVSDFHGGDFVYCLLGDDSVQSGWLVSKLPEERIVSLFRAEVSNMNQFTKFVVIAIVVHGVTFSARYVCP
jgi:hypothetical protein